MLFFFFGGLKLKRENRKIEKNFDQVRKVSLSQILYIPLYFDEYDKVYIFWIFASSNDGFCNLLF